VYVLLTAHVVTGRDEFPLLLLVQLADAFTETVRHAV